MTGNHRSLELLAPAKTADVAVEAILHGADAVYLGAPAFGARKAAANSIDDIHRVVEFAHIYGAKVYVTLNTIIYEHELREVEKLIISLYRIGVDALIVQDMGILRMDIPPIELHASTQCDIRTREKALFLQEVGFSQLVLARELSINEIKEITDVVTIPVEVFVHGALCVSYSGRCQAGFACAKRSGNRGECPQICRFRFDLKDARGKILAKDKYLLSLKDMNRLDDLEKLIEAGVSSFKIEGRLKEMSYVKNIVSSYSSRLNEIIRSSEGKYSRSSFGTSSVSFVPQPDKSFNRGFTHYFLNGKSSDSVASINTPKSLGEPINDIRLLNSGDGISYFDKKGDYTGLLVNGIKDGKIIGNKQVLLPKESKIYRTSDVKWDKALSKKTAERKLSLEISLDSTGISASEETGAFIKLPFISSPEKSDKEFDFSNILGKLGNTPFRLTSLDNKIGKAFIVPSQLSALKRNLIDRLMIDKKIRYPFSYRRKENQDIKYPFKTLDYRNNVSNSLAEKFYRDHGVEHLEYALETRKKVESLGKTIMTSRYCILNELGLCLKKKGTKLNLPLALHSDSKSFQLQFDCRNCEMSVVSV